VIRPLHVVLLYNAPVLKPEHPDFASEAGVLESVAAIGAQLRGSGHQVSELSAGDSVAALIEQLHQLQPDVVVNLCESFAGSSAGEPYLAALLELLRISYTGCAAECLALARNKPRTKRILIGGGVATPEFFELLPRQTLPEPILRKWLEQSPLIAKPACEDASLGIEPESVITNWEPLLKQVTTLHQRYGAVLIERYIAGREFNVGIIELPDLQALPLAEIDFRETPELPWPIVTYASKWSSGSKEDLAMPVRCPAAVESELAVRIEAAAVAAYRLIGCRDYARIDLRVDDKGQLYVLEVNANPDTSPKAGLARMLKAAGIEYGEFSERLLETTRGRNATKCDERRMEKVTSYQVSSTSSHAHDEAICINIRGLRSQDRSVLIEVTRSSGVFRADEIQIADEVLGSALRDGPAGDYQVLVADIMGLPSGWSCHGRVPLTDATFDLYWIAVTLDMHGRGIGRKLLAEVEHAIRAAGGRWLLAETSSTAAYHATHGFYQRCGFRELSQIDDFYRPGDGKITFGKRLDRP
jgi:D-alanine-D-alanine ligase